MEQTDDPEGEGWSWFQDEVIHAQALLSKWVTKALDDPTLEWAKLFIEISKDIT